MRPRLNVITLGVRDVDAALAFYRDGMGLLTHGIIGRDLTVASGRLRRIRRGKSRTEGYNMPER
jgi:catechol 2,3-dioxygenase-like lactoylglutathione lyase family enzyme